MRFPAWRREGVGVTIVLALAIALPHTVEARKKPPRPPSISFHWAGVPGGERTIEVWGLNGSIRATHSASESLIVEAVKRGNKSDPDDVVIEADTIATGVRVCARYPRPSGALNECGGDQQVKDNDVTVDFTIQVPPGARLVAHNVNGSIGAEDMQGPVEATTVNGGIDVVSTHRVTAATVNGSIDVTMGPLAWAEPLEYTTTNGSVLLRLPASAGARLDASSANGDVVTELPLTASEQQDRHRVVGQLGKGGPRLRLETVNGNIEIRGQ
jgi:Putative adhesin